MPGGHGGHGNFIDIPFLRSASLSLIILSVKEDTEEVMVLTARALVLRREVLVDAATIQFT